MSAQQRLNASPSPARRRKSWRLGRNSVIALPYGWLLLFFILPFAFVLKISLAEADMAIPPYTALVEWLDETTLTIQLTFSKYQLLLEDRLYLSAYLNSLKIAAISTIFCLLIGFPIALFIVSRPAHARFFWLAMVMLPFWTSMLLRVYAWIGILQSNGLLNTFLMNAGIINQPLVLLHTDLAVYLGIVYSYLPFMVLPLYAALEKLDPALLEASADLGARPAVSFFTVTLPLAVPGIIAGCLLVFVPAVGEFVIPALLGAPDTLMIGRVLWDEFFANRDWPMASAVAIVMLIVLVAPVMLVRARETATRDEA